MNVRTKNGGKTGIVPWQKRFHIVMPEEDCRKGFLNKVKPYAFTLFAKKYGEEKLLDCLEANEKKGIIYHREGLSGDYDGFDDADELIEFILHP